MRSKSTIADWLKEATKLLKQAGIESSRLDAELILAHTLRKSRTYLHAHGDETLNERHQEIADARLRLREGRVPLAYIVGHKEFYGRLFKVTPATLVPRPESETIIDLLKKYVTNEQFLNYRTPLKLVDVGTGSGCLGVTAKLEIPNLEVTLTDIDRYTLNVASENATHLKAAVHCVKSNLLDKYHETADFILANLPYVDSNWQVSKETKYEPSSSLFSTDQGLGLTLKLLRSARNHISKNGIIIIETDLRQHDTLISKAAQLGYTHLETSGLISVFSLTVSKSN